MHVFCGALESLTNAGDLSYETLLRGIQASGYSLFFLAFSSFKQNVLEPNSNVV
jgi:hypothetical protein